MLSISGTITVTITVNLKSGRSTIRQVASAAGVSTQTVSRVLNERPDVAAETRSRVQTVIDRLGYRPSALARSLIRQRSYTLGVVTAGLRHIGPSRTLGGVTAAAADAGYALLLEELPRFDMDDPSRIIQALLSRHVDGVIWAVPEVGGNRKWVEDLPAEQQVPIVYLTMEPRQNVSVVSINNYLGARLAMAHLIDQGYGAIGHIAGPLDWWEARQRMAAWKDALREAGLAPNDESWIGGNWSSSSGSEAAHRLFDRYPRMDAVFVANDQMALGVLHAAASRGRGVPQDLAVVGFDNIPESGFFLPALTTVQQDQYNVGKVAVEEIARIIESGWQGLEPIEPKSIMLSPSLIVRNSSRRLAEDKGGEIGTHMKELGEREALA
jgi:DNA-binding LacI/PurR family transcriptional regulator